MTDVAALMRLAIAREGEGRRDEAIALFQRVVAIDASHAGALLKLGLFARSAGRLAEASAFLERARDAARARGSGELAARLALAELGCMTAADDAQAWLALGGTLMEVEIASPAARDVRPAPLERALAAFDRARALAPQSPAALAQHAMANRYACRWADAEASVSALMTLASSARPLPLSPIMAATLVDDPALQARTIADFASSSLPVPAAPRRARGRRDRLRVGYLSSDFHEHATARLAAGMFEAHDGSRVETFAYALDRDDGSAMRKRLRAAFGHWRDVAADDDAAVAARIAADDLDVLVDLKGHTQGNRLGILAARPAPVQIHWLGFPGTIAYGAVDAQVADAIVVPSGDEVHYRERILRMPHCYQANDRRRPLPPAASRASVGLPDDAIVLASFNQTYKLSRRFFDAWLDALERHRKAVLWLAVPHALAREQMLSRARARGLVDERIVYAPLVGEVEHMARLRCADLALDVLPYGSHTTGSDALWCGVPLLTLAGRTFAGRVGASLVAAAGLPSLATETFDDYCRTLDRLVGDRDELAAGKSLLERERFESPLFDTERFARDFESMLEGAANLA